MTSLVASLVVGMSLVGCAMLSAQSPELQKILAEIRGERHGPARRVGGGRPLPAADGRVERAQARARDRRRQRLQRDLDRDGAARDGRKAGHDRIRPGARQGAGREHPARRPVRHRPGDRRAMRSSRSRKCTGRSTSCSWMPGRRTTSGSSTWCYPRLDKGGLFLAHNVVNKRSEMGDFLDAIQKNPRSGRLSCRRPERACRCR